LRGAEFVLDKVAVVSLDVASDLLVDYPRVRIGGGRREKVEGLSQLYFRLGMGVQLFWCDVNTCCVTFWSSVARVELHIIILRWPIGREIDFYDKGCKNSCTRDKRS
jgi:hypothetical protein